MRPINNMVLPNKTMQAMQQFGQKGNPSIEQDQILRIQHFNKKKMNEMEEPCMKEMQGMRNLRFVADNVGVDTAMYGSQIPTQSQEQLLLFGSKWGHKLQIK